MTPPFVFDFVTWALILGVFLDPSEAPLEYRDILLIWSGIHQAAKPGQAKN